MGALYPGTSVSGYNANPPPDDGTTGANNQITWAGIKSKVGDPLNTFATAVDANVTAAFGKTISGASVVSTAVNYPMTAADQGRNIVATASGITVTTPDATVVHSPFVMCVNNQSSGNITIAGFGGTQNIDGATTANLGKGRGVILWTDGANWFSSGFVMGNLPLTNPPFSFDAPINLSLSASVGSNLLTVTVNANDGTTPTTSNPVLVPFRSGAIGGSPGWVAITSALSISTNAVGASLGTANGIPFRFWICLFNNAGTAVLALWHSGAGATAYGVAPLTEYAAQNTTGISAAATSSATFYTPNGTSLSGKAFRIIGYLEYSSGLATAGTYSSGPSSLQLFGPGIPKPGESISRFQSTAGSVATPPTSSCNLVHVECSGTSQGNVTINDAFNLIATLKRGATSLTNSQLLITPSATSAVTSPFGLVYLDQPQTTSSTTWSISTSITGTGTSAASTSNSSMVVQEVMG